MFDEILKDLEKVKQKIENMYDHEKKGYQMAPVVEAYSHLSECITAIDEI
jgi:hypothetical protein